MVGRQALALLVGVRILLSQLRPSMPLLMANVYTLCPCAESDTLGSPTSPPRHQAKSSIYPRAPATSLFHGLPSTGDGSRCFFPGYVQIRLVGMNRLCLV